MKKNIKLIYLLIVFLLLSLSISLSSSEQLKVTEEHPFFINGKYIPAKSLEVGDTFQTLDNKTARITNIQIIKPKNPFFVYNLEVPFFNNFVVGLDNLIVHNSNSGGSGGSNIDRDQFSKGLEHYNSLADNMEGDFASKYKSGLEEVSKRAEEDYKTLDELLSIVNSDTASATAKKKASGLIKVTQDRINQRYAGLSRRAELFSELPIADGAKDFPDYGLYEYEPIKWLDTSITTSENGRRILTVDESGSHFLDNGDGTVTLQSYHYTPDSKGIIDTLDSGAETVFRTDETGWAFFTGSELPSNGFLTEKEATRVLGTGNQFYSGKTSTRTPSTEMFLSITVPKKRVFAKTEKYVVTGSNGQKTELSITKYAIAGGVKKSDIVGEVISKEMVYRSIFPFFLNGFVDFSF